MNKHFGVKVSGKVVRGEKYGRKLGFPTANLERRGYVKLKSKPRLGVWAGTAILNPKSEIRNPKNFKSPILNHKSYIAGIVIGPVDKSGLPKIEAYLLGFKGNLYGKKIVLYLQKFVRPFKKFKSVEALKKQIKKDIKIIKQLPIH